MSKVRAAGALGKVRGLALFAILAMAAGCGEATPDPEKTDPNNNPGIDRKNAREKAYGKAGVPQGKQAAPPAKPQ